MISIRAEIVDSVRIADIARDACALATRIGCAVDMDVSGIDVRFHPHDEPADMVVAIALARAEGAKFVFGGQRPPLIAPTSLS